MGLGGGIKPGGEVQIGQGSTDKLRKAALRHQKLRHAPPDRTDGLLQSRTLQKRVGRSDGTQAHLAVRISRKEPPAWSGKTDPRSRTQLWLAVVPPKVGNC